MENETEKIFTEQLGKLPQEVVTFISSASWNTDLDEIGELYNLTPNEIIAFKREVTLVLAGLVHPDALTQTLAEEAGIQGAVLEALVANIEKKIFATVRPALVDFFNAEYTKNNPEAEQKIGINEVGIVPDNLPTDLVEIEPTTPLDVPQVVTPSIVNGQLSNVPPVPSTHPFEEKMKRVFTAGQQNMNELIIKTPESQSVVSGPMSVVPPVPPIPASPSVVSGHMSVVPPVPHTDPYREPIE